MNVKHEAIWSKLVSKYQKTSFGYKRLARLFNLKSPQTVRDILRAQGIEVRWQLAKRKTDDSPKFYEGEAWDITIDFTNNTTRAMRNKKARLFENDEFRLGVLKLRGNPTPFYKWYPKRTKNPTREQIRDLIKVARKLANKENPIIISDGEFTPHDKAVKRVKPYSRLWSIKENCFGNLKSIAYHKRMRLEQVLKERAIEVR